MPTTRAKKKTAKTKKKPTGSGKRGVKSAAKAVGKKPKTEAPSRRPDTRKEEKLKRQLGQERKVLRSQSRWLQKALFALGKAEGDHAKLAEVRGQPRAPMSVTINGASHEIDAVTDALRDAVISRLERLRVTLRKDHDLLG